MSDDPHDIDTWLTKEEMHRKGIIDPDVEEFEPLDEEE